MRILRAVALIMALGACGGAGGPGSDPVSPPSDPDAPVAGPTGPGSPVSPSPRLVRPREGLVDVHPIRWERARVTEPRTLLVEFTSGVEACYGLDRVEVRSGPRAVTVTLYEGRVPMAEACIELAVQKAVQVRLAEPLGDRDIRDGARAG
ncbi:MAG TPA: hypothetical protein VHL78_12635 [Actinomycetota bacterium]|nr:hypothetical protein [Actinomycetota bacterium]